MTKLCKSIVAPFSAKTFYFFHDFWSLRHQKTQKGSGSTQNPTLLEKSSDFEDQSSPLNTLNRRNRLRKRL
jgi:hypothetical protein